MNSDYNIQVTVETRFLDGESAPEADHYVFAYTVTIKNNGTLPARLLSRHWQITDGDDNFTEVKDFGVVGQHPHLEPGETFTYTSGTVLETPTGQMKGSYQMLADDGTEFNAIIPAFHLTTPQRLH